VSDAFRAAGATSVAHGPAHDQSTDVCMRPWLSGVYCCSLGCSTDVQNAERTYEDSSTQIEFVVISRAMRNPSDPSHICRSFRDQDRWRGSSALSADRCRSRRSSRTCCGSSVSGMFSRSCAPSSDPGRSACNGANSTLKSSGAGPSSATSSNVLRTAASEPRLRTRT
jgi:hypothetical protein